MTRTMLIAGASRGIGAALAAHHQGRGVALVTASRSPSAHGRWIGCNLAEPSEIERLAREFGDGPLDALLMPAGLWERDAFTDAYGFESSPPEEAARVLAVNLLAPILLVRALLPNLRQSANPRVVLIGSLSGRDGHATREVANTASKFGLRGAAQALAIELRTDGIGFTVVNPGNVATPEVLGDVAAGRFGAQVPIPMEDLLTAIDCTLAMSPASTIAEIDIAQRRPGSTA